MRRDQAPLVYVGILFAVATASGCTPKEKVKTEIQYVQVPVPVPFPVPGEQTAGTSPAPAPAPAPGPGGGVVTSTDVSVSGTLALTVGNGLSLVEDAYSLNCVTFEKDAKAYSSDITKNAQGNLAFSKKFEGIAGRAFGCFLLLNGSPVSTLIFDAADSSLVTGAGDLKFDIQFNKDTKTTIAKIDHDVSSALDDDAVAAAKAANGAKDTVITDLTGNYGLACVDDDARKIVCDAASTANLPTSVYLSQFDVTGGKKSVAVWKDKATHDKCVTGGAVTDANPAFGMRIGTTLLAMNFTSKSTLNDSIDQSFMTLKNSANANYKTIADLVEASAKQREQYKIDSCANNIYTTTNCIHVLGQQDSYTYYDYNEGKEKTQTYNHYFGTSDFDDFKNNHTDFSGTATAKTEKCANYWTQDYEMCSPDVTVDADGFGTNTAYYVNDAQGKAQRVQLLCKAPGGGWIQQSNAQAGTLAGDVTKASAQNGCDVVASGPLANGTRLEAERRAIENSFAELATFSLYNDPKDMCKNYTLPAGFTLDDCASVNVSDYQSFYPSPDSPDFVRDFSVQRLCYDYNNWLKNYIESGAQVTYNPSTHKFDANASANAMSDTYFGGEYCPTATAAYQAPVTGGDTMAFGSACQSEFAGLSMAAQLQRLQRYRIGKWSPLQYVACTDTATVRNDFQTGMLNTCMPQASLVYVCDNMGTCSANLRCYGAPNGACVDEKGTFQGRIDGRIGVMELKPRINGAFELSSSVVDKWHAWDNTDNKMKSCEMTNETVINAGDLDTTGNFSAFYKQRLKQTCEALDANDGKGMDGQTGGTAGMAGGGQQGGQHQQTAQSVPEQDLLLKVKYTKQ